MPWLICYDIENDQRRLKIANRLLEAGFVRLQKSVFVGDPREPVLRELNGWLKNFVPPPDTPNADCVLLLPCTQNQLDTALMLGLPPDDWAEFLDPPNTLII